MRQRGEGAMKVEGTGDDRRQGGEDGYRQADLAQRCHQLGPQPDLMCTSIPSGL
jgi:hypothetical protein